MYEAANDCHGHGTHCAGTAVGTLAGVAKETPSFFTHAAGRSVEASRELWPAARRLVERLRTSNDTDSGFKVHPVG